MLCLCGILCLGGPAFAALELSTDNRTLSFGRMQLDQEKTLARFGSYHNKVTCTSTSGIPWYLKISLLQPLSFGSREFPLDRLTWQVTRTDGNGSLTSRNRFRSFSLTPDLVYISGPNEASGTPVTLRFRYRLKVPETQASGRYHTTIRFTLTEVL